MSTAHQETQQPKFIPDQRIYSLDLTPQERFKAREYLQLEKLPDHGRRKSEDPEQRQADEAAEIYRNRWREEPSRFKLLADPAHKRVCITVSAGVGKSKAMEQLVALRQSVDPDHLVILVHFSELPTDPKEFTSFLVERFKSSLDDLPETHLSHQLPALTSAEPYIRSLLRTGKLTLAVDGLDEENVKEGKKKAKALRRFLSRFPHCCCCVAGRPYAIVEYYWLELLSTHGRDDDASSLWEFWLVGSFTNQQIQEYLGPERYKELQILQADIEFTPRVLEAFRALKSEVWSRVRSVADVYWFSFDEALKLDRDKIGRARRSDLEHKEIIDFLSACAITLVLWQHDPMSEGDRVTGRVERGQEPVRRLPKLDKFRKLVFERMRRIYGSDWPIMKKWKSLLKLNSSHVEFGFFSQPEPESLIWRDATDRDFFAALWMVRSSNEAEREWFAKRQSLVYSNPRQSSRYSELYEAWSFICGVPDEAMIDWDDADGLLGRWVHCVAPIFQASVVSYRATELMFRCWPNLLKRAGFKLSATWSEYDLLVSTTEAQRCFDSKLQQSSRKSTGEADSGARQIVGTFLYQYPVVRDAKGVQGHIIKKDLENQWWDCNSHAGMRVRVGDDTELDNVEREEVLSRAYSICAYPVTNRLYALFDESHKDRFDEYNTYISETRNAAHGLNWYDAMMFCIWCHGYLPSEWEWEYAPRAECRTSEGRIAKYHHGNDDKLFPEYAWTRTGDRIHFKWGRKENSFGLYYARRWIGEWCRNRYATERRAWGESGPRDGESFASRAMRRVSNVEVYDEFENRWSSRGKRVPSFGNDYSGLRVSRTRYP